MMTNEEREELQKLFSSKNETSVYWDRLRALKEAYPKEYEEEWTRYYGRPFPR